MPSDLEARIIRLEQLIPVVSRRLVKVRAVNGQLAQVLQSGGGVRNWNDGQPTGVWHDSTCGIDLGSTLTWSPVWGISNEFSGTITLNWDSGNSWWQGCALLHWPGTTVDSRSPTVFFYDSTVACDSPVQITVIPSGTNYEAKVDIYRTSRTNNAGFTLFMPASGTCGATFNLDWDDNPASHSCSPWTLSAVGWVGSTNVGSGTIGPNTETASWNLRGPVTSP